MTTPTILVATWGDGLFAVTGDGRMQEIADLSVRGLAPDGRGGALAIAATSEFQLSCCMAARDAIYVGMDDARMPTIDINSDVHEVCAHPANPGMVVAASAIGLCSSVLLRGGILGRIAANGSSIAVAGGSGSLYVSDDFGRAWSCRFTGLPSPSGVLIC